MPSRTSQFVLKALKTNREFFGSISDRMMGVNPSGQRVARLPMLGTTGEYISVDHVSAILVSPHTVVDDTKVVLHCHGGAYTSGNLLQARVLASHIAAASSLKVMTFAYRLTPEHIYPAQLDDGMLVYNHLLDMGYAPENIALTGESAGGNLALAITLRLREEGRPLPASLALLSPWTDLLQSGESYATLRDEDATLDYDGIVEAAHNYVGGDLNRLKEPIISPMFADFTGFPPTHIHVGTKELLLSDADALGAAMQRDGVPVTLVRWEGMPHVFQIFGFQESRVSMKAIGAFLRITLTEGTDAQGALNPVDERLSELLPGRA